MTMKPMTDKELAILRRHMVELVDMHFDLAEEELGGRPIDKRLRRALIEVPRHLFVPMQLTMAAYHDTPLPIGFDKTISQPFIGALMLDLLRIEPGDHVLEVGTGLGWQAAVMSELGAEVWSVEVVEEFAGAARVRLASLGYDAEIRVGDGSRGWAEHAPFDRILVTAASASPPRPLIDQLAPGGRMVIPLGGKEVQQLSVVTKSAAGEVEVEEVIPVRFTALETDP
jgi:protein-L-isoaspartate(D-aspartate) O-methyltransferase